MRSKKIKLFSFTVTKIFSCTTLVENVEAKNIKEAKKKVLEFPEDGILLKQGTNEKVIIKRRKMKYKDIHDYEEKELIMNTSKYDRPVPPKIYKIIPILFLCVLSFGCGKTYEKPLPVAINGYYEYDGSSIKVSPSGSNSVTELSRFSNKNVVITVQERY